MGIDMSVKSATLGQLSVQDDRDPFVKGIGKVIQGAEAVKNDTDAIYDTLKVANYGLMAFETLGRTAKPVALSMQLAGTCINFIDFIGMVNFVKYFSSSDVVKDAKQKNICRIIGTGMIGLAVFGGAFLWLAELGFYKLGQAAMKIGSTVTCGVCGLGYLFMAGQAIKQIVTAKNGAQLAQGIIRLISKIADAAVCILFAVPVTCLPAIIVLGIIAKGLGLVSFLIEHYNPKAFAH